MSGEDIDKEINVHVREKVDKQIPNEIMRRIPTIEELTELRKLLEQDARTRWFWSSVRTWVLAISATIALFTVGFDGLRTILRRLVA